MTIGGPIRIAKTLSPNDAGETGAHQAGILIPKTGDILNFFPKLAPSKKNPRILMQFFDRSGQVWSFSFIYYNNALFGGTRNEYRLTRMTTFIQQKGLRPGDQLVLSRDDTGQYSVDFERKKDNQVPGGVLRLGTGWVILQLRRG